MSSRIRAIVQYSLILGVTFFLVWISLNALQVEEGHNKWDYILTTWYSAHKGWLTLMVVFFMISNVIRAERWRMLLNSAGYHPSLYKSFLSVLIAYLVNLVIPRGGEVSRCYNLYKLDKIPVEVSFGTVVVERIVDVLSLIIVFLVAFSAESKKLVEFISSLPIQPMKGTSKIGVVLILILVLGLMVGIAYWYVNRNQRIRAKFIKIWTGFRVGLVSIRKLDKKGLFIFHSLTIWILYFLMTYAVIQSFDETAHLGMSAVLSIFTIGTIAMAVPLPGGTGSYHVLIPAGLVILYKLPQANAVAFTFVFHGWQTLIMIVAGVTSMLLSALLLQKKSGT